MSGISRRSFLKSMIAAAAAPAFVRAESLMKLWVPPQNLVVVQPVFSHLASLPLVFIVNRDQRLPPMISDGSLVLDRERGIVSLFQGGDLKEVPSFLSR